MPFLSPNLASPSLDDPVPSGNSEENRKEELEAGGSREAAARATEEAISFITSYATLRPSSSPKAGDACGLRRLRRLLRLMPQTSSTGD
ncbi:hypothetical protein BHE74_00019012 [Ensete ventricosum]|nr:hypothetical protein BHE74_00019012 [Ensete ventricosum]